MSRHLPISIADAGEFRFARFYIVWRRGAIRDTRKSAHCLRLSGHSRECPNVEETEFDANIQLEEMLIFLNEYKVCINIFPSSLSSLPCALSHHSRTDSKSAIMHNTRRRNPKKRLWSTSITSIMEKQNSANPIIRFIRSPKQSVHHMHLMEVSLLFFVFSLFTESLRCPPSLCQPLLSPSSHPRLQRTLYRMRPDSWR